MPELCLEITLADVPGFKNRMRELRKQKGLTLEELGARIGVHHTTLARWEKGEAPFRDKDLIDLAAALGCSPIELITDPAEFPRTETELAALRVARRMPKSSASSWLDIGERLAGEAGVGRTREDG